MTTACKSQSGTGEPRLPYVEDVQWCVSSLAVDKRKYAVGRLVQGLGPVAKSLVRKWKPDDIERVDGVDHFINLMGKSALVRQPLPDADMHLNRWYTFHRQPHETIGEYLIRENNMHTEFMSAMFRLKRHTKGEAAEPTIPPSTPATPARRRAKGKGKGDSSAASGTDEAAAEEEEVSWDDYDLLFPSLR